MQTENQTCTTGLQPYCTYSKEKVHSEDGKRVVSERTIDDPNLRTDKTVLVCIKTPRVSSKSQQNRISFKNVFEKTH